MTGFRGMDAEVKALFDKEFDDLQSAFAQSLPEAEKALLNQRAQWEEFYKKPDMKYVTQEDLHSVALAVLRAVAFSKIQGLQDHDHPCNLPPGE